MLCHSVWLGLYLFNQTHIYMTGCDISVKQYILKASIELPATPKHSLDMTFTLKAPITTAADDNFLLFFFYFSEKASLDISCEEMSRLVFSEK